ncbi:MAG: tRNA (adenosine(37)-N6)-threonylcarbamoyltransferase complex ATPase subunit type 1 TsaE [Rickettsiaceae bacterium]|jgi:tRNA threonylcarbamoyladenosine biosynthesis protein TsaE|nr:tRNA (adenosine(37)-N6)-threonylcarbamoyltransferase complex ATPase subunit type 1 TsaE [Rickettsiaceae bacterium]
MSLQAGKYILYNEEDSKNLAIQIANEIKPGNIITFSGDLGAGKTFLCRQIIKQLCGPETNVTSPTFNLLQIYDWNDCSIYHYDLYRLKNPSEIYELGIEEAMTANVCLIEWPELIKAILPNDIIAINIEIVDDNKRRVFVKYK